MDAGFISLPAGLARPGRQDGTTLRHGRECPGREGTGRIPVRRRAELVMSVPHYGQNRRPKRVGEMLRRELSQIIPLEFRNTRQAKGGAMITVMDVSISDDLKNARVTVSVGANEATSKATMEWLKVNRKTIRYSLAQKTSNMRSVPELHFRESSVGSVFNTLDILAKLEKERALKGDTGDATAPASPTDSDLDLDALDDDAVIE